jgi:hypothetical protein
MYAIQKVTDTRSPTWNPYSWEFEFGGSLSLPEFTQFSLVEELLLKYGELIELFQLFDLNNIWSEHSVMWH